MNYPTKFESLIKSLQKLPGVGRKSAERMAFQILKMKDEQVKEISDSLINAKQKLHYCPNCGMLTDLDECNFCNQTDLDKIMIIVQTTKDAYTFLNMEDYKGYIHVLNGAIDVQGGIGPSELNLSTLKRRVHDLDIKEVIVATNPDVKGETTAQYIKALLDKTGVMITRLAYGLPVGSNIDYIDEITIKRAVDGRIKL